MSKWSTYGWQMLWSILLVVGLAAPGAAQETTGTIAGSSPIRPAPSCRVSPSSSSTSQTGRTAEFVTNESGRYHGAARCSRAPTRSRSRCPASSRMVGQGHRAARQRSPRGQRQAGRRRRDRDRRGQRRVAVRAADAGGADPDGPDAGPGAAAQQPQLRAARDAGARRLERPLRRSRHRPDQHGQHLDQRRPAQRA